MVRRKKQVKPRGAAGDKPEAALTLASRLNERSPLVALPAEIQGIITSHVRTPMRNAKQTMEASSLTALL